MTTYSILKSSFKPLDLLLFRGTDFISNSVCIVSRITTGDGDFSHAGLLVNSELLPTVECLVPGKFYVWESTFSATDGILYHFTDGVPNIETGKGRLGVQIRDLEQVVKHYTAIGGKVAWAPLIKNPWDTVNHNNLAKEVSSIHRIVGNRTYDFNCCSLLASAFPCLRTPRDVFNRIISGSQEVHVSWDPLLTQKEQDKIDKIYTDHAGHQDTGSDFPAPQTIGAKIALAVNNNNISGWMFCSELVAVIYQQLGIIEEKFDPQNVIPVDFLGCDADGLPQIVHRPTYIVSN